MFFSYTVISLWYWFLNNAEQQNWCAFVVRLISNMWNRCRIFEMKNENFESYSYYRTLRTQPKEASFYTQKHITARRLLYMWWKNIKNCACVWGSSFLSAHKMIDRMLFYNFKRFIYTWLIAVIWRIYSAVRLKGYEASYIRNAFHVYH